MYLGTFEAGFCEFTTVFWENKVEMKSEFLVKYIFLIFAHMQRGSLPLNCHNLQYSCVLPPKLERQTTVVNTFAKNDLSYYSTS